MKKCKYILILFVAFICSIADVQSKIVDITVQDNFFNPGNVTANVGDTVRWTWLSTRTHSTTCDGIVPGTNLPPGADPWDFILESNTPVFEYKLMVAGTYDYVCIFHLGLMAGTIIADLPLPVELTDFVATTIKNEVILDWSTGGEINNERFEVQRVELNNSNDYDPDELPFITIGSLTGNGTSNEMHNYKFRDRNLRSGTYLYRLKQIDYNSNFIYHLLKDEVIIGIPEKFNLSQNYPNPFNPSTRINFDLPADGSAEILIYDIMGKEVLKLTYDNIRAGYQSIEFDGSGLNSGMYIYRLNYNLGNDVYSKTKRMMLVK